MDDAQTSNISPLVGTPEVITGKTAEQPEQRKLTCSFCQRSLPEVGYLVGSTVARICKNCLKRLSALADAQRGSA